MNTFGKILAWALTLVVVGIDCTFAGVCFHRGATAGGIIFATLAVLAFFLLPPYIEHGA